VRWLYSINPDIFFYNHYLLTTDSLLGYQSMNTGEKVLTGITLMVEGAGGFVFFAEGLGPVTAIFVTAIVCFSTCVLAIINQKNPLSLLFETLGGLLPGK
jgi:hypothetical protein